MQKTFEWFKPALAVVAALLVWTAGAPASAQTRENAGNNNADSNRSGRANSRADDNDDDQRQEADRGERGSSNRSARSRNQHPALGVTFYNEPNMLEVRRVMPDSPAEEAGLRRGDEILSINNQRVTNIQQVTQALDRAGEDESVELGILRNGRRQTVDATLSSRQEVFGQERGRETQRGQANRSMASRSGEQDQWADQNQWSGQNQWAGQNQRSAQARQNWQDDDDDDDRNYSRQDFGNRDYNEGRGRGMNAAQNQRWREGYRGAGAYLGVFLDQNNDEQRGVWITGVQRGSPAEQAGLRRGDEILSIDDEDVESNQDVMHLLSQMTPNEEVEVQIERNGRQRTLQAMLASRRQTSMQGSSMRTGRRNQNGFDQSGYDGQYNQPYNRGYGNPGGYGQSNNRNSYGMADYDNDYGEQGYANQGYNSGYNAGAGNSRRGGAYYDNRTYGRRYQDQQEQYDNF